MACAIISSVEGEIPKFEYSLDCHLQRIQESLHFQWLHGAFCDLNLQTNDGCIQAHSCVLAAFSPKIALSLNNTVSDFNDKQFREVKCLEINMFTYNTVKAIVEALYSGLLTTAVENVDELLAALQWLEIAELVEVVRSVKAKAEKGDLFAQDIKLPLTDSCKIRTSEQVAQKSKPSSNQDAALFDSNNTVTHNEVSNVMSLNTTDKGALPQNRSKHKNLVKGKRKKASANLNHPRQSHMGLQTYDEDDDFDRVDTENTPYSRDKILRVSLERLCVETLELSRMSKRSRKGKSKSKHQERNVKKHKESSKASKKEASSQKDSGKNKKMKSRMLKASKSKAFIKHDAGPLGPNSLSVVVSQVNDMPVIMYLDPKDKRALSEEAFPHEENSMKKESETATADPCHEDFPSESCEVGSNTLSKEDHQPDCISNTLDAGKTSLSSEILQTQSEKMAGENSEQVNASVGESCQNNEQEKTIPVHEQSPKPVKKRIRKDRSKKKDQQKSKLSRYHVVSWGRKRRYQVNTTLTTSDDVLNISEEGEKNERQKQAKESLQSIESEKPFKEIPESDYEHDHYDLDGQEEAEQAFLNGETNSIKCSKCKVIFTDVDEYRIHVQNHPTFTCETCYTVYYSDTSLSRHVRRSHLRPMHLKCRHCGFSSKVDKEFAQHCFEIHQDRKPFKCLFEGCNYEAAQYKYLTKHFDMHDNRRQFVCEKCQRSFPCPIKLSSHKRACYNSRVFLCDLCGQGFNQAQTMKLHRDTVHFGERPHKCKVCLKSFSNGANLRRHMRIHNNSFPYSCSVCSKQFRHSNMLKLHMSKHEEAVETTPGFKKVERGSLFPPNQSNPHLTNSSLPSDLSTQPGSILSSTSSLPSLELVMPTNSATSQTQPMTLTTVAPAKPTPNIPPAAVNVIDEHNAMIVQYINSIQQHGANSYHQYYHV